MTADVWFGLLLLSLISPIRDHHCVLVFVFCRNPPASSHKSMSYKYFGLEDYFWCLCIFSSFFLFYILNNWDTKQVTNWVEKHLKIFFLVEPIKMGIVEGKKGIHQNFLIKKSYLSKNLLPTSHLIGKLVFKHYRLVLISQTPLWYNILKLGEESSEN